MQERRIAVTSGDPAGVGPELCLRLDAWTARHLPDVEFNYYCDAALLDRVSQATGLPPLSHGNVVDCGALEDARAVEPGKVDAGCGRASYDYLAGAIRDAMHGTIDAIVTAPLNKEALRAAGITFPGHTEILTELTGAQSTCMLQYSQEVTASFVTCHCGYAEVPGLLTRERLREVIDLTHQALARIKERAPRLLALGLNPHAGEHGLFGNGEEETIILPEVEAARARGVAIEGPIPPDTAFLPATRERTDAFICMYHDQGHIPLKALAFDNAVNVTLGLPIIRTSVDHGTAYDIAWKGLANPGSLVEAAKLALKLHALR